MEKTSFVCPSDCPYQPKQFPAALIAASKIAADAKKLEEDKAALLKQKAALKRQRRLIDKGWSYVFALFMAFMAPLLFIKNVQFDKEKLSLASIEVRESNPTLLLVYFGFIGGILGLPTQKVALSVGKVVSSSTKDVLKSLAEASDDESLENEETGKHKLTDGQE